MQRLFVLGSDPAYTALLFPPTELSGAYPRGGGTQRWHMCVCCDGWWSSPVGAAPWVVCSEPPGWPLTQNKMQTSRDRPRKGLHSTILFLSYTWRFSCARHDTASCEHTLSFLSALVHASRMQFSFPSPYSAHPSLPPGSRSDPLPAPKWSLTPSGNYLALPEITNNTPL